MDTLVKNIIKQKQNINPVINNDDDRITKIDYKLPFVKRKKHTKNASTKETIYQYNMKYLHKQYNIHDFKETPCSGCKLPDGMFLFRKLYTDTFLGSLYQHLEETFQKFRQDPSFSYQENKKRVFMFDNMNILQTLQHATKLNHPLGNHLFNVISDTFAMLQAKPHAIPSLLSNSKLVIARYSSNKGIYTHIDNVKRSDGIVLTLSVGTDNTYYDVIPLDNSQPSMRLHIKEGEPVVMDGLSRYVYAHGIPNNIEYVPNKIRYSLIFLISNYNSFDCKFDNKFYHIKICKQNDYSKYIN